MIAEQHKCLDAATLADLLAGRMPTDRFSNAIEHIESCDRCMQAVEENSSNAKLSAINLTSESPSDPKFDVEPECAAVVGNLLLQPIFTASERSSTEVDNLPPLEMLGPYRLIKSLGSGGMGTVYLAEHQRLKRQVAIKLLPRDKLARSGWLDRFNREMTAIAALEHPHIVRALDAGDEDQWHYLVMEHLEGLDLNRVARRIPEISVGAACEMIRQAALGLGAIHDAGMIHRDIKPSNLFLTRTGTVKLLDLGLVLDGESPLLADERLTTVGHLMGTLPFMAREQLDDARSVDWRADIYSLGATLYRLLGGRPPYGSSDNLARTIQAIATSEAKSIGALRTELPKDLVAIVDRMISSDVAKRPQSGKEVAELLLPYCDESGPKELIRAAMQCTAEEEASFENVPPPLAHDSIKPPRSTWPWWIAAALLPLSFAAGIIITIATDRGTLVIETDLPNANIKIVQGDQVVDQMEVTQSQPSTLILRSGKYIVELTGVDSDRMEVKNNQVLVSRGEQQVVKVIRRESTELAESNKPTISPKGIPTKTFQDKSLEEWMGILKRERSGESLAQAMEAVNSLVDTPSEKSAAARLFLQASRGLGGNSTVPKRRGGGASWQGSGGSRGGGGGRGSVINTTPELPPPPTPTEVLMTALERYFPKLYSHAPEDGLLAIAEELETGTDHSKTACICLLRPFSRSQLETISKDLKNRELMVRLDQLVMDALNENQIYKDTREKGFGVRIDFNKSLARDLKLDQQILDWGKGKLKQSREYLEGSSNPSVSLDASTALITYRLLQGMERNLATLLPLLIHSGYGVDSNELDSAVAELCEQNPVESAVVCEAMLKRGFGVNMSQPLSSRERRFLETFGMHHPRPMEALVVLVKGQSFQTKDFSIAKQLLVRVVLETDLANDPEADSKLAYAATAFATLEIPEEKSEEVLSVFLNRLRNYIPTGISFQLNKTWPREELGSYEVSSRLNTWTLERLHFHLPHCIAKSPTGAFAAIAKELRSGNDKIVNYCFSFSIPVLVNLTAEEKRIFDIRSLTVDQQKSLGVQNLVRDEFFMSLPDYLQTNQGKVAIQDLGAACDQAVKRMLEQPIAERDQEFESRFQLLLFHRLLVSRFLDQDPMENETLTKALEQIVTQGMAIRFITIAEAIAEQEGYSKFSNARLLQLAKTYSLSAEQNGPKFVNRILQEDPTAFRLYFLKHLESIATSTNVNELIENFGRWAEGTHCGSPYCLWQLIVQNLRSDPASRDQAEAAIRGIINRENILGVTQRERTASQRQSAVRVVNALRTLLNQP